ncbi:hypothetical protein GTHT12_03708 (plasmid) [Geobacillus thermodenitrificans]|uniref:hypothetical protein n=1 Tax=Geobacillus thermodenitrificans TaxID=33940 RepID=UPI000A293D58|nr:hypothetical protein [Geobacillus thermodenitrificans]ARP44577.1 hypothetical protein GTHT12_03708 [Geobacillus thermodenitrificans]
MSRSAIEHHLFKKGLTLDTIIDKLKQMDSESTYVLWSSYIDGLGSDSSDIDVYQICMDKKHKSAKLINVENITLDIEQLDIDLIEEITKRLKNFSEDNELDRFISIEKLKIMYRLKKGYLISFSNQKYPYFLDEIDFSTICKAISHTCYLEYISDYNDALRFYKEKNYKDAHFLGLTALYKSLGVFCANQGKPMVKMKWYYRVFESILGRDHELVTNYWNVQNISSIEDLKNTIESLLKLSQRIIIESTCLKGGERV